MKKFIILSILLIAGTAFAEPKYRGTSEALRVPGTQVLQIFDNFSTIGGTGEEVNSAMLPDQATWELVVASGTPSAYEVVIEASIRNVSGSWYPISTLIQTDVHFRHINTKPAIWYRPKLVSKTGAGSFDAYIILRGN
ncbi:hypothetical protein KAR91_24635 [Candidatus Pacearchaeota archaeon]|nr:hypothetical protein [Candidatus Pacearchaeota archaeon]